MGDKIRISGNKNSNVNFKGKQSNVNVNSHIETKNSVEQSSKDIIIELLRQLQTNLQTAPPNTSDDLEEVSGQADDLLKEVSKNEPDKVKTKLKSQLLVETAKGLKESMPFVLDMAQQILQHIPNLFK